MLMKLAELELAALGIGAVLAVVLLYRLKGAAVSAATGALTGDNALTRSQTNAAGEATTAYVGVPVLGTLGAAANTVSGGWLATAGENIGGWFYEATHADPLAPPKPAPYKVPDVYDGGVFNGYGLGM